MLYYAGFTKRIGNVDEGSTVTDFLPAERKRGITIQSAAITFHWPPPKDPRSNEIDHPPNSHIINLIDTPGHADFTFEVLRSLRVLDSAVCILDGVAGVEAQTEKVWHQAQEYQLPKIIYVNKLDRVGAEFGRTVRDIVSKLHVWPAVCQIPWYTEKGEHFQGVVDIVWMRALSWARDGDGRTFEVLELAALAARNEKLAKEAKAARAALVELLSEHDEVMVQSFIDHEENHLAIPGSDIVAALRRCVLSMQPVVPIFAGASFKNVGVQPLLDAITQLLPNPQEATDPEFRAGELQGKLGELAGGNFPQRQQPGLTPKKSSKKDVAGPQKLEACALAFKVVTDTKRGVLVYVRTYHGRLSRHDLLFNTNLKTVERVPRLLRMYADDAVEIPHIQAGQIGVIPGLRHARTGDTLIVCTGLNAKRGADPPWNEFQLRPIKVPPPVFYTGIEPINRSEERNVEEALTLLLREDPSLHVSWDEDTGQQLLSGMGELHLEIARDRLLKDFKAQALTGDIEIGYRESVSLPSSICHVMLEREIGGVHGKAGCAAKVYPREDAPDNFYDSILERDNNVIKILVERSEERPDAGVEKLLPSQIPPLLLFHALQTGALAALSRGPQHRFPVHGAEVLITVRPGKDQLGSSSTPAIISLAAREAVKAALQASNKTVPTALMEPIMNVKIMLDQGSLGAVVRDISSSRGGQIVSLDEVGENTENQASARSSGPDLRKIYSPPDPFESSTTSSVDNLTAGSPGSADRSITARVPLREMIGYLKFLRSLTKGRGTFIMSMGRFERMSPQREKVLIKHLRGAF